MNVATMLMSAGLGTRLDPLTRLVAKPAVPLGDRTLIERVLEWLAAHECRRVVINLHHIPDSITAIVGDGSHLGVAVRYSWEYPLLGSAGGPRHALPLLDADRILLVNGDTLCDVDLAAMIDAHVRHDADVTMAVVPNAQPDHYNGIVADHDHAVTAFVPRGHAAGSWHFVGVQIVNRAVLAPLPDGVPADTVHGLYRAVLAQRPGRLRVWPTSGRFIDVGTPRDYLATALAFHTPAPAVAGLHRCVVWSGCSIGARTSLDECVVVGGAHVPDGFVARRAVLAPAALRRADDRADEREGLAIFPLT